MKRFVCHEQEAELAFGHSVALAVADIAYGQIDPLWRLDQRFFDQFLDQRLAAGDIGSA